MENQPNKHFKRTLEILESLGFKAVPNHDTNLPRMLMTRETAQRIHPQNHPEFNYEHNRGIRENGSVDVIARQMDSDSWGDGTEFSVIYSPSEDKIRFADYQHRTFTLAEGKTKRSEMTVDIKWYVADGLAGADKVYTTYINPTKIPHRKQDDPSFVSVFQATSLTDTTKHRAFLAAVKRFLEGFRGRNFKGVVSKQDTQKAIRRLSTSESLIQDTLGKASDKSLNKKMQGADIRALFLISIGLAATQKDQDAAKKFFQSIVNGGDCAATKKAHTWLVLPDNEDIYTKSLYDLQERSERYDKFNRLLQEFKRSKGYPVTGTQNEDNPYLEGTTYRKSGHLAS